MKKSLLAIALSAPLFIVGCGSDNDDNYHGGDHDVEPTTEELVNEITGVVTREALLQGLVDPLIVVTDNAYEGMPCQTGSVNKTNTQLIFDKCDMGDLGKLTGSVTANETDSSLSYEYKGLIIQAANGEKHQVTGAIKLEESDKDSQVVITSDALNIIHDELVGKDDFQTVVYELTKYKLVWTDLVVDKTVSLASEGSLNVKNSTVGDYAVNFSTPTALVVGINDEEEVNSMPSDGQIYIVNQTNEKDEVSVFATTSPTDAKFKATIDGKLLFDKTEKWDTILSY